MVVERTIEASVHGRYLVAEPVGRGPAPVLVGFHGYAETPEIQLARLQKIPGADRWLLVSVQALHTFYRGRSRDVVASWMTTEHRDLAIADNLAYVARVLDAATRDRPIGSALVFAGFSQGVAMAFRAAASSLHPADGVIALGGDVPPELGAPALARTRAVLVGRGSRDEWYTADRHADDVRRLGAAGVALRGVEFEGAHEWPDAFAHDASSFLESLTAR